MNKSILINLSWRILQTFSKQGLVFIMFYLSSLYLSPNDFSIYTYIFVVIYFLALLWDFGISSAISKYAADFEYSKNKNIEKIIPTISIFLLLLSIIIILILIFWWKYLFNETEYYYFLLTSPLVFLIPITSIYDGMYRWVQKFKNLAVINVIIWILWLILFVVWIKMFGIVWAFISQVIYYCILFIWLFIGSTWKNTWKFDKYILKFILKYSIYIWLATIWYSLYTKADIVTLKYFWYIEEIWHYEIISRLLEMLILPFILIWQVIWPKNSALFIDKKYTILKWKLIKESILFLIMWIIFSLLFYKYFYIFSWYLFPNYNIEILTNILSIIIFIIPIRFYSAYITQWYITPSGKFKDVTYLVIFFWIINIISNLYFTPIYWIKSIYISTVICMILYLVLKDIFFIYYLTKQKKWI